MTITRLNPNYITLDITKEDWESGFRSRLQKRRLKTYDTCLDCAVARAAQKNGYADVRVGNINNYCGVLFLAETRPSLFAEETDEKGNLNLHYVNEKRLTSSSSKLRLLFEEFDEAEKMDQLPGPARLNLRLTRAGKDYFSRA